MIEGSSNRVPASPHWDLFRKAERGQPDLIAALSEEIRKYAAGHPKFQQHNCRKCDLIPLGTA